MNKRITTLEIEVAMMTHLNIRQNIIVPNISWGMQVGVHFRTLHECDLLMLSKSGYATEIEIKVSKHDLLKDAEKSHNHNHPYITNFYFAVPLGLKEIALEKIPERTGLYTIEKRKYITSVLKTKRCIRRSLALRWDEKERSQLARLGTMRILRLKKKILSLQIREYPKCREI